jgi:hypothetical protein
VYFYDEASHAQNQWQQSVTDASAGGHEREQATPAPAQARSHLPIISATIIAVITVAVVVCLHAIHFSNTRPATQCRGVKGLV